MRFIIQRVSHASVEVEKKCIGKIEQGFLVFIGIKEGDTKEVADRLIKKLVHMRIFSDENDKINLSLSDVNGSLLLVSQFTLYANCKKGNRPSFTQAAPPKEAEQLYEYIVSSCKTQIENVQTGQFGADMKIDLRNEGPFTILLDSEEL